MALRSENQKLLRAEVVESTADSQRQISRSSCTETSQKALRHMPDKRLLDTGYPTSSLPISNLRSTL